MQIIPDERTVRRSKNSRAIFSPSSFRHIAGGGYIRWPHTAAFLKSYMSLFGVVILLRFVCNGKVAVFYSTELRTNLKRQQT